MKSLSDPICESRSKQSGLLSVLTPHFDKSEMARFCRVLEDIEEQTFRLFRACSPHGSMSSFEFFNARRIDPEVDEKCKLLLRWCHCISRILTCTIGTFAACLLARNLTVYAPHDNLLFHLDLSVCSCLALTTRSLS